MSNLAQVLRPDIVARIPSYIDTSGPVLRAELGNCHVWTGSRNSHGYGVLAIGKTKHMAHRVVWTIASGEPPALCVLHKCDGGGIGCVRLDHLFLGTKAENTRDMVSKGRNRSRYAVGERVHTAKLSDAQVSEIRALAAAGVSRLELARRFGVSKSNIYLIVTGRSRVRPTNHDYELSDVHVLGSLRILDGWAEQHGGSHCLVVTPVGEIWSVLKDRNGVQCAGSPGKNCDDARYRLSRRLLNQELVDPKP